MKFISNSSILIWKLKRLKEGKEDRPQGDCPISRKARNLLLTL
jgi:hypothetical protein